MRDLLKLLPVIALLLGAACTRPLSKNEADFAEALFGETINTDEVRVAHELGFFVPRPPVPWPKLIALGLLLGAGQYGFLFLSMTHGISAALSSLLIHSQAFFTIVIAMLVFGERLRRRQLLAMGLALAGLAFLVVNRAEACANSEVV